MAALIPLILEYTLKYGVPAATALIEMFKKETITWDDWLAVFATAQTPYGLTPQIVAGVVDLGVVTGESPMPAGPPPGVATDKVIVKILPDPTLDPKRRLFCNYAGNCWSVLLSEFTRAKLGEGETWTNTAGLTFWIPDTLLTGLNA